MVPIVTGDFLDMIRLLKVEMLEAMDTKLALILSTQTAAAQNPVVQCQPVYAPVSMDHNQNTVQQMWQNHPGGQNVNQHQGTVTYARALVAPMQAHPNMGKTQHAQLPAMMPAVQQTY